MDIFWICLGSLFGLCFLLFAVYLVLIAPAKNKRARTLEFTRVRYAHRGLHRDGVPENSLEAFRLAVESGYGIELDVRLSRDGELVVFHDDTLDRVTAESGRVADRDCAELENIKLLGSEHTIPRFSEVLELVRGRVPLLVEIKEDKGSLAVTEKTCETLSKYEGEYMIESFNPLAIKKVRELMPDTVRGVLSSYFWRFKNQRTGLFFLLQTMALNCVARPDFVAFCHNDARCPSFWLARHVFGVPTLAWTIKSVEEEERALIGNFDSVIFEGYTPVSPYIDKTEN